MIVLGLATTLVLVLLLFQVLGLRGDMQRAEERAVALRAQIEAQEPGVTADELEVQIDRIEAELAELGSRLSTGGTGSDVGTPAGEARGDDVDYATLVRRIDLVLERIDALDERVDEICESVPVC